MTLVPDAVQEGAVPRDRTPSRLRLVLLVLEGYVYLASVIAFFVAAVAFLAWGVLNRRPLIGLVAVFIGLPLLVTTFRAFRSVFFIRSEPEGILLTPRQGSGLLALVSEVREQIGASPVHRVLITKQYSAAALQVGRAGIFWPRNTVLLGYPMLATLAPEQIRAVVAHELAHLARAHGRLVSWIHRTRLSWLRLMNDLSARDATPLHAYLLFRWYVPRLDVEAAAMSREQERRADALAATIAGAETMAQTLVAIELGHHVFAQVFWPEIFKRLEREPDPPRPFSEIGPAVWRVDSDGQSLLTNLLASTTSPTDTHPSLRERLARLGQTARLPATVGETAAHHFFGAAQPEIALALDRVWQSSVATKWRQEHQRLRAARERLETLAAIEARTSDQTFELAALFESKGDDEKALGLYRSAYAAGHMSAAVCAARILLDRGDEAGLTLIDAAIDADPLLAKSGNDVAIAFLESRGRELDAERFRIKHARQATLANLAATERSKLTVVDRLSRGGGGGLDVAPVIKRLAFEPTVLRAFLVSKELRHSSGTQIVLALRVNGPPGDLTARLGHEPLFRERVQIVTLGRDDRELEALLEQTPGALIYERSNHSVRGKDV